MELERHSTGAAWAAPAGDSACAGVPEGWALVQHDWGLRTLDDDPAPGRVWRTALGAGARWLARALRGSPAPTATEARR